MTMLVAPIRSRPIRRGREARRARAVYGTLRTTRSRTDGSSLLAELAMLAVSLLVVVGVIVLRAWLHMPQL